MSRKSLLTSFFFCLPFLLLAQSVDVEQLVSFRYRKISLGEAIDNISKDFQLRFSYSPDVIPVQQRINIRIRKVPLSEALDKLFDDTKVVYAVIGDQIVLRTDPNKETKTERIGSNEPILQKPPPAEKEEPRIVKRERPRFGWDTPTLEDSETPYLEPVPTDDAPLRRTDNSKYSIAQITLVSYLGTNYPNASETTNRLSLNVLWGQNGGVNGVEVGGIANTVFKDVRGLQIAGIANRVGGNVYGTQIAGIYNRNGGYTGGFQFAGLINRTGTRSTAVQISGLLNMADGDITGAQGTLAGNIVYGDATALQIGGLFNFNQGDAKMQVASLFNHAKEVETGQASLLLNKAQSVEGFQFGLINLCDSIKGAPIGLLSLVKYGYNRIELFGSDVFQVGLGAKLGAKPFYNILQLGFNWDDPILTDTRENRMSWALGYGFGTAKPLGKKGKHLWNLELLASHINEGEAWTKPLNLLGQFRLSFDFYVGKRTSLFFGPTFNLMFSKLQSGDFETPTIGSRIPHWTFYNNLKTTSTNTASVRRSMWAGFQAGVRF